MIVGLLPISAKPFHAGHDSLIRFASRECNVVQLFVSLTDRARKGEIPIYGNDMEKIWKSYIESSLPGNCRPPIYTRGTSPISEMYLFLEQQEKEGSNDTFVIYSDSEDIKQYKENILMRYMPTLLAAGQVKTCGVERTETVPISGTKMRSFLVADDRESFKQYLPPALQPHAGEIFGMLQPK